MTMATYQTRLVVDKRTERILAEYAALMGKVERHLFASISAGKSLKEQKSLLLKKLQITARQFNACRVQVEGKIASIHQRRPQIIEARKEQIASIKKKIEKLEKKKDRRGVHLKKRRLARLESRLANLLEDQKKQKIRLCYGGRKLFRAQFALEKNGFSSHEEWKKEWGERRDSEFFTLGSKEETAGNQTCTATINEKKQLVLRLRLPNAFQEKYGKYVELPPIHFAYGNPALIASLHSCLDKDKEGRAICYRFKKDRKGWRVFATTAMEKPQTVSQEGNGAIGIDINANHLAVVETDRFGNPLTKKTFPLSTYGKTKRQSLAVIGDVCASIVQWASISQKQIVLEKLDFQKKKNTLREENGKKQARMLSSFAYSEIIRTLESRAWRKGIDVYKVNPAYTSTIGMTKFAKRYGLSAHHAAALCIARRNNGFSEQPPKTSAIVPDGREGQVTFPLPERNRGKHVWSFWRELRRKMRTAHAAHFQAKRNRSSDPPQAEKRDKEFLEVGGESPPRESLVALLD